MDKHTTSIKQAYEIGHLGYTILPIVAGLDKFAEVLTDWDKYLAPIFAQILPLPTETLMKIGGVLEILVGILVFFKPKIGAYVAAVWFLGIIINLLLLGKYFDIALRDFGLMLGALMLARLAIVFDKTARKES